MATERPVPTSGAALLNAIPPIPARSLTAVLGALTAFGALSIDMYLPALATIGRNIGADSVSMQTTLSVFFIGLAIGQLIYGPLSDRFGRLMPLYAGLCLYVVASIGCALATSVEGLWTGRLAQALGACAGLVISRAAVRDLFDPMQAARVFSRLMLVMGLAPVLAPLIGGQLLLVGSWRLIFWTLAVIGLLTMIAVRAILPETHRGPRTTLHPVAVFKGFVAILRDHRFLWHALTGAFASASLLTYIVASPAVLIEHYGVSPQRFGLFFGANAVGLVAAAQLNAHWLRKQTPQRILRMSTIALFAAGVAVAITALTGFGGVYGIAGAWFCQLTSMGFVGANAAAGALKDQGARAGSASAVLGSLQFGLGAVSGAVCSALAAMHWVSSPLHATGVVTLAITAAAFAANCASAAGEGTEARLSAA